MNVIVEHGNELDHFAPSNVETAILWFIDQPIEICLQIATKMQVKSRRQIDVMTVEGLENFYLTKVK